MSHHGVSILLLPFECISSVNTQVWHLKPFGVPPRNGRIIEVSLQVVNNGTMGLASCPLPSSANTQNHTITINLQRRAHSGDLYFLTQSPWGQLFVVLKPGRLLYSKPFSTTIWFLCNDENNLRGHVWCVTWNQRPGLLNLHLQHRERRCDASRHVTWTPIKAVCCLKLPFCWVERRADSLGYQVTGVFTQGYYEICRARGHCVSAFSSTVKWNWWLVHPTAETRIRHKRTSWDTIRHETYSVWENILI